MLVENPEEQDTEQDIMALLAEVNVLDSYGYSPTAAGGFAAPEPAGVRLFVAPPHAVASGRDLVGRGWHFFMPGHRLILCPTPKPGGAPRSLYTLLYLCMPLFCLLRVWLFAMGRVLT